MFSFLMTLSLSSLVTCHSSVSLVTRHSSLPSEAKASNFFPSSENGGHVRASETTRVCERDLWRVIDWHGHDSDGIELGIKFSDMRGNRSEPLLQCETTKSG